MNPVPATLSSSMIQREIGDDHICLLTFDRPESGANIFDAATLNELNQHLGLIENDSSLRGLLVTSAKRSIFIAGADLETLLRQAKTGGLRAFIAEGQRVFNRLAALKIPTCAAIHGACAGGGYEVTLACDYRVASDDPATRIWLPETTLGLVPAWGGPTPARALEVIKKGLASSVDQSLALELDAIVDLGETESTQNLIRNFFLAEKYKKGTSKTASAKVVHAAVIGAGVMGSGIAQWL